MKCEVCKHSGANMKICKKCGKTWCQTCAFKGMAPYPKQTAANKCPYCGGMNCMGTPK